MFLINCYRKWSMKLCDTIKLKRLGHEMSKLDNWILKGCRRKFFVHSMRLRGQEIDYRLILSNPIKDVSIECQCMSTFWSKSDGISSLGCYQYERRGHQWKLFWLGHRCRVFNKLALHATKDHKWIDHHSA